MLFAAFLVASLKLAAATPAPAHTSGMRVATYALTKHEPPTDPQGIVTGPDGAVWFTEYEGDAVGRITTTGALTEFPLSQFRIHGLMGIAAGSDGAMWFTEPGDGIGRITTDGAVTNYPLSHDVDPYAIVAGADGALWFTERGGGGLGRITTAGVFSKRPLEELGDTEGIAAGPDGALWISSYLGGQAVLARVPMNGAVSYYPRPVATTQQNGDAFGITGGPDNAMWLTQYGSEIVRAGLPATFVRPAPHRR
jgi:virginiamycin B lyase